MPTFLTKNVVLDIFVLEFSKSIAIFEIRTLKHVYLQNFTKKEKCLNLRPKMADLGIFGQVFRKKKLLPNLKTAP